MLFSSLTFIYFFLPAVLLLGWLSGKKLQNYVLLIFSLIFYAWGGVSASLIVILSIIFNFYLGKAIGDHANPVRSRRALIFCITGNLLVLCIIKYGPFLVQNLNVLLHSLGAGEVPVPKIKLIPGISFFTFHSISYVVDIYRKESEPQRDGFTMGLYIVFFPQLIAGPIIRYHEIASQFTNRVWNLQHVAEGIRRFILGLTKKVIFSNAFAYPADQIFAREIGAIDTPLAWFGIVCYTLHIYCDFSGYSDMALGLGKMFGFTFPENFNFPYSAASIQDFWHRWHMTLSRWFRDYVYIPLGGNRNGTFQTYRNLVIVFFLTGLWHGASWTMVVWGLFHGFFLVLEQLALKNILPKLFVINRIYTLVVVMIAWVFFKSTDISFAWNYIGKMFAFHSEPVIGARLISEFFTLDFALLLLLALLFSSGIVDSVWRKINSEKEVWLNSFFWQPVSYAGSLVLLVICSMYLTKQGYNPFIYFQF